MGASCTPTLITGPPILITFSPDVDRRPPSHALPPAASGIAAHCGGEFDLQSAFATRLQCRTLFSHDARGAAFCELVGATTTYIVTGESPGLRADLPPADLVAACAVDGRPELLARH